MQCQRQLGRCHPLSFERLPHGNLVMLGLGLHAQFIALEGNAVHHRHVQLLLVIAGGLRCRRCGWRR